MKSNFILFNTLLLAAPVALCLQASALAQATDGTNTLAAQQAERAAAPGQQNVEFFFPGGTPQELLSAVEKQYKVDWKKVADIPDNMLNVRIPALRMNQQSVDSIVGPNARLGGSGILGGGGGQGGFGGGGRRGVNTEDPYAPLNALIALYNSLGRAKPELGRLLVEGDLLKPSVVIFHSSAPTTQTEHKVKAFALNGIPATDWEKLESEINSQFENEFRRQVDLAQHSSSPMPTGMGHVTLHKDTVLLVVDGPESSVETAESFVNAWRDNHQKPAIRF